LVKDRIDAIVEELCHNLMDAGHDVRSISEKEKKKGFRTTMTPKTTLSPQLSPASTNYV